MEMSPCMGLRGYAGECPGFLGGTNAMSECSAYCCLPMALNAQPCYSPPNLDLNSLVLAMHSLWVPIGDRRVGLPWYCVSRLCVNNSQILSTSGVETTTMME